MRRYHERRGTPLDEMPMTMPISPLQAVDRTTGDQGPGAMFAAPIGVTDPEERIAMIHGRILSLGAEPALYAWSALMPLLDRVPSAVRAAADRLRGPADMSAATFPGTACETFLAGAKVDRTYPFGPLTGAAVMAAMVPYAGTCCVGMTIDGSVVPDSEALVECMREGLDEVLALTPTVATRDARPLVREEQT
jgi:hypothetical protein